MAEEAKDELLLDISVKDASRLYKFYLINERLIIGVSGVFLFLFVWEYVGGIAELINPIFMSAPSRILKAGYAMFASGEIYNDMWVSGKELFIGFGLSIVTAIPLGLLAGWYRRLNYAVDPFLDALNATPRVALLPLIIIWVGIGIWSKVVIVYLGAFFPIIINTLAGVKTTDVRLLKAARSFKANDAQVFKTVILPSTAPFIMSGLRQGLGRALVGVVVGELYAATAGVGFMITVAGATFQTDKVFVGVLLICIAGVALTKLLGAMERRFDKWRPGFEGLT
ncbi:MAG: ABC transporter permease [Candidatus Tectomicrobia bacterium]|uniref:ABC transporter permease n=1 Tax=Tectimicrobiota bacterium TaxID=2528274 RepID=A0A932GQR4_UNCTE|nr:ABC transporter permease [Candidatus Tectomicrobia bacterium]